MVRPATREPRNVSRQRSGDDLGEPAQVLGDGRQRELVLGTARAAQSKTAKPKTAKPKNALEVGEPRLDALAVTARLLESFGLAERTGDIAGIFVDAAGNFARGLLSTAS